jgi:[Skp1-protein]-hydroxyproline N-acetylglucosaminyltransferase
MLRGQSKVRGGGGGGPVNHSALNVSHGSSVHDGPFYKKRRFMYFCVALFLFIAVNMFVLSIWFNPTASRFLKIQEVDLSDEIHHRIPNELRSPSPSRPGESQLAADKQRRLSREPLMFQRGDYGEEYTLRTYKHFVDESVKEAVARMKSYTILKDHIFVQIGHYRDDWCDYTLRQIFTKCRYCDRVIVGLAEQIWIPWEEYDCKNYNCQGKDSDLQCLGPRKWRKNVRVIHLHEFEAAGPTWSRYLTSKLWRGEEYFLQIDAHMDFVEDWDVKVIQMMKKLPSSKALVSHYPVSSPDQIASTGVPWICNVTFDQYLGGLFTQNSNWYWIENHGGVPQPTPFIGAGFLFGPSKILIDAPYDRYLPFFFHGEEFLMASRLWTRGWDFFVPTENIVSHIYGHRNHSVFSDTPQWWVGAEKSRVRARYILGLSQDKPEFIDEVEDLGLGTDRSFQEYTDFAGLDMANRKINSHCLDIWDYSAKKWVPDMTRWENQQKH